MSPYKNTGTNETSEGRVDVPKKKSMYNLLVWVSDCLCAINSKTAIIKSNFSVATLRPQELLEQFYWKKCRDCYF